MCLKGWRQTIILWSQRNWLHSSMWKYSISNPKIYLFICQSIAKYILILFTYDVIGTNLKSKKCETGSLSSQNDPQGFSGHEWNKFLVNIVDNTCTLYITFTGKHCLVLLTENKEFNPHITSFNFLVGAQPANGNKQEPYVITCVNNWLTNYTLKMDID